MPTGANVLHADLDAFYASVEQRDHPELRGRPVIVGGGVVLCASYEARVCGVRTAMGGREARRLCPQAEVVTARMSAYSDASKEVFEVFKRMAPTVEALSIDEAFLDVRGLDHIAGLGSPEEIARLLRAEVRGLLGLPITVGVARTKFLAKVASGVAKPDGLLVVHPERELEFLHPLPVERVWGVGRVTEAKLRAVGIRTVGELAATGEERLMAMLGRHAGRHLYALACGRDPRPVRPRVRRRSIGSQRALGRRARAPDEVAASLVGLVDRVTRRLRAAERSCRTIVLRLRFADYSRATRSTTLPGPTTHTSLILDRAERLLGEAWPLIERRGLTLIGIALTNLCDAAGAQLSLFDQAAQLDAAVDLIRERYGTAAITRGVLVGRDPGITVPLLPD